MKFLVLALCVCAAAAAPQQRAFKPWQQAQAGVPLVQPVASVPKSNSGNDVEAVVLRSESDVRPDGYNYAYETGNGIVAQAVGTLKKVDNQDVIGVQGSWAYTAPDGTPVQLSYVADENGYQPSSDILPVGPAIPVAIVRSLEYIAAHPQAQADTVVVGKKY